MNEYKSKARIIERILSNRINYEWYERCSNSIENEWFIAISVALGVYLKYYSKYFIEYQTNIFEFLEKYKEYSLMKFKDFCEQNSDICDAMIKDLKNLIGENEWYVDCGIKKENIHTIKHIMKMYNDRIIANEDVTNSEFETEISNVVGGGYSLARAIALAFYEREEFIMVCLKFYKDHI